MNPDRYLRRRWRSLRHGSYFGGLLNSIYEEPGWFVPDISGGETSENFAYTVGLWHSFQHPELIVTGLPAGVGGRVVNACGHIIKEGGPNFRPGERREDVLDGGYPVTAMPVPFEGYQEHALSVEWFYGYKLGQPHPVPMMQLVWSSKTEPPLFPWEAGYPDDKLGQPLLADPGSLAELKARPE